MTVQEHCRLYVKKLHVCFCQAAQHLTIDDKLKDILKGTAGGSLMYVVVEGKQEAHFSNFKNTVSYMYLLTCMCAIGAVQPVGEALTSTSKKVDVGVLQKLTLSEHRLLWNSFTRSW